MTVTTKQRAQLRSLSNGIDTIMQIGKGGISPALIKTVNDALEARELIKMRVLENSGEDVRTIGEELAQSTDSLLVTTIGSKIVLYRPASDPDRRKIVLVK